MRVRRGPATVTGGSPGSQTLAAVTTPPSRGRGPSGGTPMTQPVLLLSTADTELLAARGSGALYRTANPARVDRTGCLALLDGVAVVVLRLLGGRRAWPEGVDALVASGLPVVLLGGEAAPDAELMAASTVPAGVASEALRLPRRRRPGQPARAAPVPVRHRAAHRRGLRPARRRRPSSACTARRAHDPARPTVGVVFYRAHELSRQHRVRRRPVRRDRGPRRQRAAGVLRRRCAARDAGADGAARGGPTRWSPRCWPPAARSRRTRAPAATRTPGTPARWPRSTCRCCRGCA